MPVANTARASSTGTPRGPRARARSPPSRRGSSAPRRRCRGASVRSPDRGPASPTTAPPLRARARPPAVPRGSVPKRPTHAALLPRRASPTHVLLSAPPCVARNDVVRERPVARHQREHGLADRDESGARSRPMRPRHRSRRALSDRAELRVAAAAARRRARRRAPRRRRRRRGRHRPPRSRCHRSARRAVGRGPRRART